MSTGMTWPMRLVAHECAIHYAFENCRPPNEQPVLHPNRLALASDAGRQKPSGLEGFSGPAILPHLANRRSMLRISNAAHAQLLRYRHGWYYPRRWHIRQNGF